MKPKQLFKKITPFLLLMALMVIVAISCKKKDEEPTPTPPTPGPVLPPLFSSSPKLIMTNFEISQKNKFPASLLYNVGYGLRGEDPEIPMPSLKKLAKVAWEVHDYVHTEHRFDTIDSQLMQISQQLTVLQNDVVALSHQVTFVTDEILTTMKSIVANTYVTNINNAFDDSSSNTSLRFYSWNANQNQQVPVSPDTISWSKLSEYVQTDFIDVYQGANSGDDHDMKNCISQLHTLIMGNSQAPYSFSGSSLKTMADLIITSSQNKIYTSEEATMAYRVVEDYFMSSLTSQFKALIVWANAAVANDTIDGPKLVAQYIQGGFGTTVKDELSMFINVADYMAVNLYDHRTLTNFGNDMNYFGYGIKEDAICGQLIARANMVNTMILAALATPVNDFYITMALPAKYSSGVLGWTGGGTAYTTILDQGGSVISQYPYTYWESSAAYYDNVVSFYRGNGGNGGSTHVNLSQVNIGITGATWRNSGGLSGNAPIGYYDPNDLSKAPQSTYTLTYSLAFGSVSLCWPWGYMYLNDNNNNVMTNCSDYEMDSPISSHGPMPYVAQYEMSSGGDRWLEQPEYEKENSYMTWGDESLGYNGPTLNANQMFFTNVRTAAVTLSSNPLITSGTGIYLFSTYTTDPLDYSGTATQKFWGGTNISDKKSTKDLFNVSGNNVQSGTVDAAISSGSNSINFGFSVMLAKPTGNSHEVSLSFYSQPIYWGNCSVPK
ncbi:MAG: hypothetical protein WCK09_10630 [Bacteroidota bacterium]